nr:hypothetical protein CFP56_07695 [Quercus suber]
MIFRQLAQAKCYDHVYPLQKLFKILAALSLSLSRVVGQKASLPNLLLSLFTGVPILSAAFHTLSKPAFEPDFVRSQKVCDDIVPWKLSLEIHDEGWSSPEEDQWKM